MQNFDGLLSLITEAVHKAIADRVAAEIAPAVQRIAAEEVAKVGLHISSMLSFERMGQDIRITVYDKTRSNSNNL